jgi:hypothetical protein
MSISSRHDGHWIAHPARHLTMPLVVDFRSGLNFFARGGPHGLVYPRRLADRHSLVDVGGGRAASTIVATGPSRGCHRFPSSNSSRCNASTPAWPAQRTARRRPFPCASSSSEFSSEARVHGLARRQNRRGAGARQADERLIDRSSHGPARRHGSGSALRSDPRSRPMVNRQRSIPIAGRFGALVTGCVERRAAFGSSAYTHACVDSRWHFAKRSGRSMARPALGVLEPPANAGRGGGPRTEADGSRWR